MPPDHSCKSKLYEKAQSLLGLPTGDIFNVLDFGCGCGEFLGSLEANINKDSTLIGIDSDATSLSKAKSSFPSVDFRQDNFVDSLDFEDSLFDVVVTIDTIECIPDKSALLKEIHRVLKPGGQVLALHWDWDTQIYNVASKDLARRAVAAFSDWKQSWMECADGQMGRKLWGLFEGSGLFQGKSDTFSLIETDYQPGRYGYDRAQDLAVLVDEGGFDPSDYQNFCKELSESYASGQYHYTLTSFIYHGRRK